MRARQRTTTCTLSTQALIEQAPLDCQYMREWVNDPQAHYTRGICERHQAMADALRSLLAEQQLRDTENVSSLNED